METILTVVDHLEAILALATGIILTVEEEHIPKVNIEIIHLPTIPLEEEEIVHIVRTTTIATITPAIAICLGVEEAPITIVAVLSVEEITIRRGIHLIQMPQLTEIIATTGRSLAVTILEDPQIITLSAITAPIITTPPILSITVITVATPSTTQEITPSTITTATTPSIITGTIIPQIIHLTTIIATTPAIIYLETIEAATCSTTAVMGTIFSATPPTTTTATCLMAAILE